MKVAICIPRHGDTKGEFTISLARMIAHSLSVQVEGGPLVIEVFSAASSDLPANRTRLLQDAIRWQARWLLWADSDHVFPRDALLRLLKHRLPVVGCNQPRRSLPTGPVAVRTNDAGEPEHVWTTEALARAGTVEEVRHVGLALCLLDMNALHQVKAHVEAAGPGWANWEPFAPRPLEGGARMGEDVSFFHALTEAGVKVHVDHALSWEVGHIAERVITNADAVAQKEAWLGRHG